jgi:hypothetical protein
MSLNIIDCTTQYRLPELNFLRAYSNNAVFRMCRPIEEIYDFILYLLKFDVHVYIKVVDKNNVPHTHVILDSTDLRDVFEILAALSEREER